MPKEIKKIMHTRYTYVFIALFILSILIIFRVFYLEQFKKNDLLKYQISIKKAEIPARRGDIYSKNKNLIATTILKYSVHFDPLTPYLRSHPDIIKKQLPKLCQLLVKHFPQINISAAELQKRILNQINKGNRYIPILKNLTYNDIQTLKTFPIFNLGRIKGGFIFSSSYYRTKPYNAYAAKTIGDFKYYYNYPRTGLEAAYNAQLAGTPGYGIKKFFHNTYITSYTILPPKEGKDLLTSLDMNIQAITETELYKALHKAQALWGTAVVMDVHSGQILAMANLTADTTDTTFSTYYENYNYAVHYLYEPGSVMKPLSMLALFEEYPKIKLSDTIFTGYKQLVIRGHKYIDDTPFKFLTVKDIIAHSSNIGMAKLILKYFANNPYRFINRLTEIGVGKKSHVDLLNEPVDPLKSPNSKLWTPKLSLAQLAVGYEHKFTPLQILALYNAIANNGKYVQPHLGIATLKDDKIDQKFSFTYTYQIASKQSIYKIKQCLKAVVNYGTAAKYVKLPYLAIAGKTGTAQYYLPSLKTYTNKSHLYNSTFVGFFPADKPKYSIIIVIHNIKPYKYGGPTCGPVFKNIAKNIFTLDSTIHNPKTYIVNLFPKKHQIPAAKSGQKLPLIHYLKTFNIPYINNTGSYSWTKVTRSNNKLYLEAYVPSKNFQMPNLLSLNAADAIFLLEYYKLNPSISGHGKVIYQSVPPYKDFKPKSKVLIKLAQ